MIVSSSFTNFAGQLIRPPPEGVTARALGCCWYARRHLPSGRRPWNGPTRDHEARLLEELSCRIAIPRHLRISEQGSVK
jgi:hypothetical protein